MRPPRLAVFGPPQVIQAIQAAVTDPEKVLLDLRPVYPLETWQHGDYRFACYPANHGGGELECQFYSVDDGRRRLLYATDTGPLPEAAWQALSGQTFDCIVLEETMGYKEKAQHLGLASFLEQYHRFQKEGILRPGGRMVATHLSHQWNPVHDKLVSILEPQGVTVAYDGLTLEL